MSNNSSIAQKVGLVLSGGGSRGAYQAGVMRAMTEIMNEGETGLPISVITGVSAGAINAGYLASYWENPLAASASLCDLWSALEAEDVFKTDAFSIGHIAARWIADTALGSFRSEKKARSLLDTSPLHGLLAKHVDAKRIAANIEKNHLEAVGITALDYQSSTSITFVQGHPGVQPWDRLRRRSESADISVNHIMSSAALPLFFPPIEMEGKFYGDGSLRNLAPLSPAIHLGADKLLVISVRRPDSVPDRHQVYEATIGRVLGVIMNAILLDAIEVDMERMSRINNTLSTVPETHRKTLSLRPIQYLWLRPSHDIASLATKYFDRLPPIVRYLIGGLGTANESAELTSYLLFDPEFCGALVDMGYEDGWAQKDDIKRFLRP